MFTWINTKWIAICFITHNIFGYFLILVYVENNTVLMKTRPETNNLVVAICLPLSLRNQLSGFYFFYCILNSSVK